MDDDKRRELERARAAKWLEQKWTNPDKTCPICSTNNWSITEVLELRGYMGGNIVLGGNVPLFPVFQLICSNCAHTYTFNAALSGVVQQEEIQSSDSRVQNPSQDGDQHG
jgi:hypothetical protein